MNLSRLFILRPVATVLLSLAIMLVGAVAFRFLGVAPLPQVDTPTIVVRASLPGASPETMAATVAAPLERTLGQIAGITEMTSYSSLGSSRVILQFSLSRDINGAARDVQAAINAARTLLPSALRTLPTYRKANPSETPILTLALTSETLDRGELYDIAYSHLQQRLSQIKGVGEVLIRGGALPAVRVDLDPEKLSAMGIALDTVRAAIANANTNLPAGSLSSDGKAVWITHNGQLGKADDTFRRLVVAWRDGAPVHLQDVARVYNSTQDIYTSGYINNKPSVSISITKEAGSNIVETIDEIKRQLPQMNELLPEGSRILLATERSTMIRQALRDTEETLAIATLLVIGVVYLFLRRGRAVLIPALALPISILGTFAAMYAMGFSLNTLSMMALIVSTGFVVDDAIVVLENIQRHIDEGMEPMAAALEGSREIGFTVLSMTASLIAVFIPLFFMEEMIGRLFREFAVTLSAALLVSLFVSLTLTPMLCARCLKRESDAREGPIGRAVARALAALERGYAASLAVTMRHGGAMLALLAAILAANAWLYCIVDKGLFPMQDNGQISGALRCDQTSSFQQMDARIKLVTSRLLADPDVETVQASTGGSGFGSRSSGSFQIRLKDLPERKDPSATIANRLTRAARGIPGARLPMAARQDVRVGGRSANAEYQFSVQSDDLDRLRQWSPRVYNALRALPELTSVDSDAETGGLNIQLEIDRERAQQLGVDVRTVDTFLNNAFSQRQIAPRLEMLNRYHVILGLDERHTQDPETLRKLFVVNARGERVALSEFTRLSYCRAAQSVSHQDQMATTTIAFNLADGVSLEKAREAIDRAIVAVGLPSDFRTGLQGTAKMFNKVAAQIPWLVAAALLTIYILLGILYESWIHPITIISTLPSAGIGALLLMIACGTQFTVIAFIGILLLIGIVKKNGILMVDFAIRARESGLSAEEAIRQACAKRLRPILMTTMAAFFGAVPLILGQGQNASFNRPLGIAICGGLAVSQILTLYTTPAVYLALDRLGEAIRHRITPAWLKSAVEKAHG